MQNPSFCKPKIQQDLTEGSQSNKYFLKNCMNYSHNSLVQKYSNQRQYFHAELMNHILDLPREEIQHDVKFTVSLRVNTVDFKYDDQYEYLTKFYRESDCIIEMAEICQYYRYYLQSPIITDHDHFNIFYVYAQKKKEIIYKKLQNILNCTHQSSQICSHSGKPDKLKTSLNSRLITANNLENILKDISMSLSESQSENQSQCFANLRDKLVKKYGLSKTKCMEEADKLYSFKKILIKKKQFSIMKKRNIKITQGPIKIPSKKQFIHRIMLESTNNSSVQQGQSNFNVSKNLLHHQTQTKNSQHSYFRKKKMCTNTKDYQRNLNRYRTSCEFIKDIPAIYGTFRRQQAVQTKKKLRKRSCQNIFMKKFRTLDDESYGFSPGRSKIKQAPEAYGFTNDKLIFRSKLKPKKPRAYVKSCQVKLELKRNLIQKDEKLNINKECSPSLPQQPKMNIKQTIQMFKSKIRQQMREVNQNKGNENKQINAIRMNTISGGGEKPEKLIIKEKKKIQQSIEKTKFKKSEGSKIVSRHREGGRR